MRDKSVLLEIQMFENGKPFLIHQHYKVCLAGRLELRQCLSHLKRRSLEYPGTHFFNYDNIKLKKVVILANLKSNARRNPTIKCGRNRPMKFLSFS